MKTSITYEQFGQLGVVLYTTFVVVYGHMVLSLHVEGKLSSKNFVWYERTVYSHRGFKI